MKKIALTSLTCLFSFAAFADQDVVVPTLEGGFTASVGTFYAAPSTGDYNYANTLTTGDSGSFPVQAPVYNQTDYDFGIEATLGYIFEDTANGVELLYRGFHSTSDASVSTGNGVDFIDAPGGSLPYPNDHEYNNASNSLTYDFETADLMFSQFVNFGDYVQMRFSGGLAYAFIKQKSNTTFSGPDEVGQQHTKSEFNGFGPRVGSDGRYDFGDGFGIVGGVSLAYFMGELESHNEFYDETSDVQDWDYPENIDNHAVLNVRANLGIDYVYFVDNDERSTLGLEVGYFADYYVEAVNEITGGYEAYQYGPNSMLQSASFAGPYVNVKGVF